MNKIAILIDSTVYFSEEEQKKYNLYSVPLTVNLDNIKFTENHNDSSQVERLFKTISEKKQLANTSQPGTVDILNVFTQIKNDGYDRVICFHLSAQLSGTYQGVTLAASQFMEENPNMQIEVFDTKLAAQISAIPVRTIAQIINAKGDISSEEIVDVLGHYNENSAIYIIVDNLDYLAYGGRIPAAMASVGNIFGITPIITLNAEGGLEKFKSERSQKRAIGTIIDIYKQLAYTSSDSIVLEAIYTTDEKPAKKLYKEFEKITDAKINHHEISQMGIVISNHLGPKTFAIVWAKEYKF